MMMMTNDDETDQDNDVWLLEGGSALIIIKQLCKWNDDMISNSNEMKLYLFISKWNAVNGNAKLWWSKPDDSVAGICELSIIDICVYVKRLNM